VPLEEFNFLYQCNLQNNEKITLENLKSKNLICFSGSSIHKKILKDIRFKNTPLEDHIFWSDFMSSNRDICATKFLDVPIGYNQELSLSPIKTKQIVRVFKHIGLLKMPMYFINTLWLRRVEHNLKKRYLMS
jgi:hypothetical protein